MNSLLIKKILVNWFTYDGKEDISYFIYDNNWGTLYYAQSEFGANASICDHHFTYGYFMFAATVLATYDEEFYNDYKEMIEMLIRDYANPSDNDIHGQADTQTMIQETIRNPQVNHYSAG